MAENLMAGNTAAPFMPIKTGITADGDQLDGIVTATFSAEFDNGTQTGTTYTVDWNSGQRQRITLGNNITLSFTAPPGPGNFMLVLIQDGTGNRDVVWPGTVLWPGGVPPNLSNGSASIDIASFYFDGTSYYGQSGLNFQ